MPAGELGASLIGRTLGGFVVKEQIAEGGFGDVYRAEQPGLSRQAVIKVLKATLVAAEDIVARFIREAQLASRLDHPYAAHVYAFGAEPDGVLWIAMELVRGTPLDRLIRAQGHLPLQRFVPFFERVAEVVQTAHDAGVVHRDLKPANVMVLTRAGRLLPKLLDFGIAKVLDAAQPTKATPVEIPARLAMAETLDVTPAAFGGETAPAGWTRAGSLLGSPPYMAPELWNGDEIDGRTDQYALAVVVYACLTGRLPFEHRSAAELANAHREAAFPTVGPGLPKAVDGVLARAAAKRREDRFPDVLAFAAALRAAAGLAGDDDVPRLPPQALVTTATLPAPIADAVSLVAAARSSRAARDGLVAVSSAIVRFLGALAVAGARGTPPPQARRLLAELLRRTLDDAEHLELARALAAGDHALPELASFFSGSGGAWLGGLVELLRGARGVADEAIRRQVAEAMPLLGALLGQLDWLEARRLLVPRVDVAEEWRGTNRREVAAVAGPVGRPVLGGAGEPLPLWPMLQAAAPAGGGRDEVFLLYGTSRGAALLVALPGGFERRDEEARAWLVERFGDVAPAERAAVEEQPYLGLAPFTAREAGRFFGRERDIEACQNRLRAAPLLVVVGPSGAGKSSFVHAGLAAGLPEDWHTVALRPGAAPLAALAAKLGPALGVADGAALAAELAEDPASAGAFIAAAGGPPTLVVVDQLEELFTLGADAAARDAFAEALAAVADGEGPMRVVCTLRDDFLVRAAALPGLGPRLARAVHLLGTPGPDELLRIVREPTRLAGFELDDGLAEEIVRDVAGRPAALALLSFTAARLWDARDAAARRLRRQAYVEMGGVGGALGRHAEATLARLPERDRRLVREVFRHLVTAEGTRARRPRVELCGVLGGGGGVIEALIDARLLVTDEDDVVEVAHEALLAAWPRAVAWRREDIEGARVRDELRDLAQRWDVRKRPSALLLRGDDLDEARRWRERTGATLPSTDEAFLHASLAAAERARRIRRTVAFGVTVGLAALAAVYITLYDRARVQTQLAASRLTDVETERDALVLGQARSAVDRDPTAALAWLKLYATTGDDWPAVQAIAVDAWSRGAARRVLRGHENAVWAVAWSPDGKMLASGSFDRTVRLWDMVSGSSRVLAGHEGEVNGVVFTADGSAVVSASDDGTVRAWNLAGGPARVVARHRGVAASVAAFGGGRRIVSGGSDGAIRVVDVAGGAETLVGDGRAGAIQKLALAPDGSTVATVGDGAAIWLWPVAGGPPRKLEGHERRVTGVAFAPDGKRVASADIEGNVRIWEGGTGRLLGAHRGMVRALAFSPDGKLLATGGYDETVSVWDLAGGRRILHGHRGPVYGVAFSPDGARVASSGLDGQVRVWDTPAAGRLFDGFRAGQGEGLAFAPDGDAVAYTAGSGVRVGRVGAGALVELAGGADKQRSVAWAPDGEHVGAIDEAGTVRVWPASGGPPAESPGANAAESGLAFAGDEVLVPVGKTVAAWRFATGERRSLAGPADVPRTLRALSGGRVAAIAGDELWLWSADGGARKLGDGLSLLVSLVAAPDGRTLATGDHGNVVELWDTAGGPPRVLRGHGASVDPVAFSADGKLVVSGSYDKTVRVWPLAGGEPRVLGGHRTIVRRVAVAPDGSFVVSSGNDDFIRTWDLADGAAGAFAAHEGAVQGMALSPDGAWLASAGPDGTVRLWETAKRDHVPAAGAALKEWLAASTSATVEDFR